MLIQFKESRALEKEHLWIVVYCKLEESHWLLAVPKHGVIHKYFKLLVIRGYLIHFRHLFSIAFIRWKSLMKLHSWVVFIGTYVHIQGKYIELYKRTTEKEHDLGIYVYHNPLFKQMMRIISVSKGLRGQRAGERMSHSPFNWAEFTLSAQHQWQQERFYRLFPITIYRGVVPGAFHNHFYLDQSTLISLLS